MQKLLILSLGCALLACATIGRAASAYPEPPGGWTYINYFTEVIRGAAGSGFTSLDGTWSHDNGSDEWDGSAIGGTFGPGSGPGGVSLLTQDGTTFVRMQSTGNPTQYGYPEPATGSSTSAMTCRITGSLGSPTR